ncbi:PRC-barrel domain-containing protein [Trebonia sp.]|uniref:PRC-barrel domain containing protein n=1 Tax=Trebonia sp. TaxID=2767075 RepID=UPI00262D3C7F|nr:PRC-barrel domain-containing protein [Trebonia sp.]
MPGELLFGLGAGVRCAGEVCGTLKSLVIEPGADVVTHLVVEPVHWQEAAKLVPFALVESAPAAGEVRLRCTLTEFEELDAAEAAELVPGTGDWEIYAGEPIVSWPSYAPPGVIGDPGLPPDPAVGEQAVTVDTVPDQLPGADEVSRGERVHATDGDIGHVQGIAVDPGTGRVTAVLLRERHLLGRRTVLIPRSAVAEVGADGFHLRLTTEQVRHLPPAGIGQPAG